LIYVDSSVLLAELLDEERVPPPALWQRKLVSSRLTEYEVWTRLFRSGPGASYHREAREILARLDFIDMLPSVLQRALEPFPTPLRTLDALHLATAEFLRRDIADVELASYDTRLVAAAGALNIKIAEL
jgi:predicted nucleic acid-binding protein